MLEVWAMESQVGKGNMTQDDPNLHEGTAYVRKASRLCLVKS